jgi:hypothetical protein
VKTRFKQIVWRSAVAIAAVLPVAAVALAAARVQPAATSSSSSVERMYVFNCGEIAIKDISHWWN